jgi:hypothetical protein
VVVQGRAIDEYVVARVEIADIEEKWMLAHDVIDVVTDARMADKQDIDHVLVALDPMVESDDVSRRALRLFDS